MEITYTWKITSLKVKNESEHSDAVVQVYWEKKGTDLDGDFGIFTGATPFTSDNVPVGEFIPVDQLTEEVVLDWVKDIVVDGYESHVNDDILRQIQYMKNPIRDIELPWNQNTGE
jgi:hypothetical protein